jgi:hypothetical protein
VSTNSYCFVGIGSVLGNVLDVSTPTIGLSHEPCVTTSLSCDGEHEAKKENTRANTMGTGSNCKRKPLVRIKFPTFAIHFVFVRKLPRKIFHVVAKLFEAVPTKSEGENVSELRPPAGLLFIHQVIYEHGAMVEWYWQRKSKKYWDKTCPRATSSIARTDPTATHGGSSLERKLVIPPMSDRLSQCCRSFPAVQCNAEYTTLFETCWCG